MSRNSTTPSATGSPIDDIAYLARSDHRVPMLVALTVRPRSRAELWEMTGVSSSTIRRTLREFEDRRWIRRNGYQYEATRLGAYAASAMANLIERLETERKLRDVWHWLPGEDSGFTIDMCADAVVTVADADDPYRPVSRFASLLEGTDRFRFVGFDVALFEPCKEELCRRVTDGMRTEIIDPPRVANYIRSTCPELFSETLASGNLTVRLHDELPPYGVGLFDRRIAISGYDPDGVTVRVLIDTDDPGAREWANSVYESYRRTTPTIPLETIVE
ncbi:winged helix-turn-helix domain-containing protein [Halalkalicoccus sp. NIPERK01]|uniref:helix-turn-helix transcriptional regulator n=1 Tax=Halalkalicoccus sp. NIPERK01 TaxID=3053469 RepID=UPI00256F593E|nr:MarR family transcriptional regulator [Halalkalicoccus sp. NIPERK01]MDL5362228.1 MarR family transcriptional regulator [Halalkalicoccus sp. NIPERK01]